MGDIGPMDPATAGALSCILLLSVIICGPILLPFIILAAIYALCKAAFQMLQKKCGWGPKVQPHEDMSGGSWHPVLMTASLPTPKLVLMKKYWVEEDFVHVECQWGSLDDDVLLLSYAYAERADTEGQFSVKMVVHLDEKSVVSSMPKSNMFMMENVWKSFPGVLLWSDRIQTVAHEGGHEATQELIDRMGALYLYGRTISECSFRFNENYLRRGWVQQEILNGDLIIFATRVESPPAKLMKRILGAMSDHKYRIALSMIVAFNEGVVAAENDWMSRNAEVGVNSELRELFEYLANVRSRIFVQRTDKASGPEILYLLALLGHNRRMKTFLVPRDHFLKLATLRADLDPRTLKLEQSCTIIRPLAPKSEKTDAGTKAQKAGVGNQQEQFNDDLQVAPQEVGLEEFAVLPMKGLQHLQSLEVASLRAFDSVVP